MPYDKDQERIFKELVKVPREYVSYLEFGMNFVKFREKQSGKKYIVSIKEVKE